MISRHGRNARKLITREIKLYYSIYFTYQYVYCVTSGQCLMHFYINHGDRRVFFQFEIIINVLSASIEYLITTIMNILVFLCGD